MKIHDAIQGSPEWLAIRKGKPSASRFKDIVTAVKCELSKSHDAYIDTLIAQTFVPDWDEVPFPSYWMKRGTEMEPQARLAFQAHYEAQVGKVDVQTVGFVLHDNNVLGCSPDALIAMDGKHVAGLEIKCPAPNTHVAWVRAGGLPEEHKQQVHGSMIVTGLRSWHFWSYFPGMQPHHVIVHRDDYTDRMEKALLEFCAKYQAAYAAAVPLLQLLQLPQ